MSISCNGVRDSVGGAHYVAGIDGEGGADVKQHRGVRRGLDGSAVLAVYLCHIKAFANLAGRDDLYLVAKAQLVMLTEGVQPIGGRSKFCGGKGGGKVCLVAPAVQS